MPCAGCGNGSCLRYLAVMGGKPTEVAVRRKVSHLNLEWSCKSACSFLSLAVVSPASRSKQGRLMEPCIWRYVARNDSVEICNDLCDFNRILVDEKKYAAKVTPIRSRGQTASDKSSDSKVESLFDTHANCWDKNARKSCRSVQLKRNYHSSNAPRRQQFWANDNERKLMFLIKSARCRKRSWMQFIVIQRFVTRQQSILPSPRSLVASTASTSRRW